MPLDRRQLELTAATSMRTGNAAGREVASVIARSETYGRQCVEGLKSDSDRAPRRLGTGESVALRPKASVPV